MTAEIIAIGTELLLGQIVDTNSAEAARVLAECGIDCHFRQTVGDNLPRLIETLKRALDRADIVVTIGGLGPTQDDLTREGVAAALQLGLAVDESIVSNLKSQFAERKMQWVTSQLRQAMKPENSEVIDNPNGTAPGLICHSKSKIVICLPGPRGEFVPMLRGRVRELLAAKSERVIVSKSLRIIGIGEAALEEKLGDIIKRESPTVAPYAKVGEVHLRVTAAARDEEQARAMIAPTVEEISRILGDHIYAIDDQPIEASVVELLIRSRQTVCVAESCTGGLLAKRITDVAGASQVFVGGVISYSNQLKHELLGVSKDTIQDLGAVSQRCAAEMARGARDKIRADFALSVTGIAGPGGGTEKKPVGLVYIGLAGPKNLDVKEFRFRGTREDIRSRSATSALNMLRDALLNKH